jgi:hypothetical protein
MLDRQASNLDIEQYDILRGQPLRHSCNTIEHAVQAISEAIAFTVSVQKVSKGLSIGYAKWHYL